jgi:hypothetical protein
VVGAAIFPFCFFVFGGLMSFEEEEEGGGGGGGERIRVVRSKTQRGTAFYRRHK